LFRKERGYAMSTNVKEGKNSKAAAVTKLMAGGRKHFPNGSQEIPIGGTTMTISDLLSRVALGLRIPPPRSRS
jgi:hypothetical protein